VLFNGFNRDNIAYGFLRNTSETEVIEAAKAAECLGFLFNDLEHGLDTMVGENGVLLSVGSGQRIALPREHFNNAPILILDEAKRPPWILIRASLQVALDGFNANRTTICYCAPLINHRKMPTSLPVVDHVKIIELGSHSEFVGDERAYAQLHITNFTRKPAKFAGCIKLYWFYLTAINFY